MNSDIFEIMHKDRRVARIDSSGRCKVYYKSFMPYNLYLEEEEDVDTLVNNITNFVTIQYPVKYILIFRQNRENKISVSSSF